MANEFEKQNFLQKLDAGTYSHAYIVEGPEGIGKKEFALWCTSALLCSGEKKPCGKCLSCRKIEGNYHPDVVIFGSDEKAISVGDIRDLIQKTQYVPTDGSHMVFILQNAQKMQSAAQNALLKIFEEPPEFVTIFLLTDSKKALLPTIRSRGQTITLHGESVEEIVSHLKMKFPRVPDAELREAAELADGSYGNAENYLSKDAIANRETANEWMDAALAGDKYRLISTIATPKYKRESLIPILDCFLHLTFDYLLMKSGEKPSTQNALENRDFFVKLTKKTAKKMCDATVVCIDSINNNGNITATMTAFASALWMAVS